MARTRYDVSPDDREGWLLTVGTGRSRFPTKEEAVRIAARDAKIQGNARVVVHNRDGTIESERTYGKDRRTKKP